MSCFFFMLLFMITGQLVCAADLGQLIFEDTGGENWLVFSGSADRITAVNKQLRITNSTTNGVYVQATDSVQNNAFNALFIDHNISGSDSLSGERQQFEHIDSNGRHKQ